MQNKITGINTLSTAEAGYYSVKVITGVGKHTDSIYYTNNDLFGYAKFNNYNLFSY